MGLSWGLSWGVFVANQMAVLLLVGLPFFESPTVTILWVRAALLILACLALIWWIQVRLPQLLSLVAAASFSIYLFHNLPYYLRLEGEGGRHHAALHFVLGILFGIVAHFVPRMPGRRWKNSVALRRAGIWLATLPRPGTPRGVPGE